MKRPQSDNKYKNGPEPLNKPICSIKNKKAIQRLLACLCMASMASNLEPYYIENVKGEKQ